MPFMTFMRLAEHLTALGARDDCLVGEKPTCYVPGIVGWRRSMVIRPRLCMKSARPPPPKRRPAPTPPYDDCTPPLSSGVVRL